MNLYEELYINYQKIAKAKPVILNFTNSVTQDFMANTLLAIGASPIMSECESEVSELIAIANSININIGTLDQKFNQLILNTAILAQQFNKPLTLDPVGAGATSLRTHMALKLAPFATVIRGNASEIIALNNHINIDTGVDAKHDVKEAEQSGISLAKTYFNTIVISGKADLIITKNNIFTNSFGNPLMTKVTGMGCVLSSVIATFTAVNKDHTLASYLAVIFYTLCAEKAMLIAKTPAKFKVEFIDALYAPDWVYIRKKLLQNI